MADLATGTPTVTESGQDLTVEQKISQLRELFADAPERPGWRWRTFSAD
ncbi:MAG: hypothetical protein JWL68_6241 [Actinomycetia bacterium]|nr:hypothetical protein [Actinomycetes bacterium]